MVTYKNKGETRFNKKDIEILAEFFHILWKIDKRNKREGKYKNNVKNLTKK